MRATAADRLRSVLSRAADALDAEAASYVARQGTGDHDRYSAGLRRLAGECRAELSHLSRWDGAGQWDSRDSRPGTGPPPA